LKQIVMRDVSTVDTSTTLAGHPANLPVALAPVGMAGMFARGVLIGRPWVYAMAAAGEQGVVDLLDVFQREIATTTALMGVNRLENISRDLIEVPA
jgi:isopentenyl diphosphate isomerase/L-lactate dehydrogenase-like FMN-dependent dehydrogenase